MHKLIKMLSIYGRTIKRCCKRSLLPIIWKLSITTTKKMKKTNIKELKNWSIINLEKMMRIKRWKKNNKM